VVEKFNREFTIQLSWLRESPPDIPDPSWHFQVVLRRLRALLGEGARAGHIRITSPSSELTARCVLDASWISGSIVHSTGKCAALTLARDTLLRGVVTR
jgi:hypothetical protein